MKERKIYCCRCETEVIAKLVTGKELFKNIRNKDTDYFYRCDCGNFVGCHKAKSKNKIPVGTIPTKQVLQARAKLHNLIDTILSNHKDLTLTQVFKHISISIGYPFRSGSTKSIEECIAATYILCRDYYIKPFVT